MINVKVRKLDKEAIVGVHEFEGQQLELIFHAIGQYIDLKNNAMIEYDTGVAVEIPPGFIGLIIPDPSMVNKTSLVMPTSIQTIDQSTKDRIKIKMKPITTEAAKKFKLGDAIARLIVVPLPEIRFQID